MHNFGFFFSFIKRLTNADLELPAAKKQIVVKYAYSLIALPARAVITKFTIPEQFVMSFLYDNSVSLACESIIHMHIITLLPAANQTIHSKELFVRCIRAKQ